MDINQLKYAIALAKYHNFSNAADNLFISQPALSQQIRKLEEECGFTLFTRETKKITLTAEGETFIVCAIRVVSEFNKLQDEVEHLRNIQSKIFYFGTSSLSNALISSGLATFCEKNPQITLRILEANDMELIQLVLNEKINMAVVSLPPNDELKEKLNFIPIREEYICAILKSTHILANQSEISLKDLLPFQLIFCSKDSFVRKQVLDEYNLLGETPRNTINIADIEARIPMVMGGSIALALNRRPERWGSHGETVQLPIIPRIHSTFALIFPKSKNFNKSYQYLAKCIIDAANDHIQAES